MTTILAIDLGKFKSVACMYDADTGHTVYQTLPSTTSSASWGERR